MNEEAKQEENTQVLVSDLLSASSSESQVSRSEASSKQKSGYKAKGQATCLIPNFHAMIANRDLSNFDNKDKLKMIKRLSSTGMFCFNKSFNNKHANKHRVHKTPGKTETEKKCSMLSKGMSSKTLAF